MDPSANRPADVKIAPQRLPRREPPPALQALSLQVPPTLGVLPSCRSWQVVKGFGRGEPESVDNLAGGSDGAPVGRSRHSSAYGGRADMYLCSIGAVTSLPGMSVIYTPQIEANVARCHG